ncbi:MAG TPA: glycerol-3-phosphate acyltransferase [Firmicutes bacterium]|nr:glycerol-3-phosphate acyltransferase [Bacillota bacterium]
MRNVWLAIMSYFLGSIPSAYIISKLFKGIDIRRVGTGNVGTVNVIRQVGILPGILTGLCDSAKGMCAVGLARLTSTDFPHAALLALLFAMIGHNWSIWLRFQGGGGLATCIGGLMLVSVIPMLLVGILWFAAFIFTRHKYASSLFACMSLPVMLGLAYGSWSSFGYGLSLGVVLGVKQAIAWVKYGLKKGIEKVETGF